MVAKSTMGRTTRLTPPIQMRDWLTKLLHRTLVASGPKRHFAAAQQTVAYGGIATVAGTTIAIFPYIGFERDA
jgi:hypothetical protein